MGITGLLRFLEDASEKIDISSLANRTVAIDSYCWLHKGAFAVADKLAQGVDTNIHIDYCIRLVNMLISHKIRPILVFDGQHLPAKAATEAKRREDRENARQRARELMRQRNYSEAAKYQRRCVDITHEMALNLIKRCREINVDCIVAPYEADAQLAYLNKVGLADYIITEDSDLILFGCRKILFKLDSFGKCDLVDIDKVHLAMKCPIEKFTMDKFRLMCILSGCDYIDSLQGIGLKKALKFVMTTEETDLMRALDKIPAYLNMRHLTITEEYKINVLKARATFLHMVVFDPRQRKQVRLHELDEFGTDIAYCCNAGQILEDDKKALNLAVGNLNPFTFKVLDNWHPNQAKTFTNMKKNGMKVDKHPSIWSRNYQWTTTLNGPSTSSTPQSTPIIKKSPRTSKRISKNLIESDDDEKLPTESQNDEMVLNQYASLSAPLSKRYKDDVDSDEQSCGAQEDRQNSSQSTNIPITPNRNPFKKSSSGTDTLTSPTRISKENNSLVKTQSPVKKINFRTLAKLSKFNRTEVARDQRVISRFFNSNQKEIDEPSVVKSDSGIELDSGTKNDETASVKVNTSNAQMKSPNLLGTDLVKPNPALYFTVSNVSTNESETNSEEMSVDNNVDDDLNGESQRIILDKFKFVLKEKIDDTECDEPSGLANSQAASDKTDQSETNELPIILSDDDDDDDNEMDRTESVAGRCSSANRNWLPSSQNQKGSTKQKKATIQRKKSSSTRTSSDSSQRRLTAMFGFEKKPELVHS